MSDDFNPDLNKYEVRDEMVETLMTQLANRIQSQLPPTMRFALFLFQEVADQQDVNIFYCASARTTEILPLINQWTSRQQN